AAVMRRLRAMGIRDKPIAPGSPWQNCFAERLIGSIRRECLDHVVALSEQHLREVLESYASYYNTARTHRSLAKDAPLTRPVSWSDASCRMLWSAVCITNMSGSEFSAHTGTSSSRIQDTCRTELPSQHRLVIVHKETNRVTQGIILALRCGQADKNISARCEQHPIEEALQVEDLRDAAADRWDIQRARYSALG